MKHRRRRTPRETPSSASAPALRKQSVVGVSRRRRTCLLLGIGNDLPELTNRQRDILTPIYLLKTPTNELYTYCFGWHLVNTWKKDSFITPLIIPNVCYKRNEISFFVGNWQFMTHEEVFLLLLISKAINMKVNVIFPADGCDGMKFGSYLYSPRTFKDSYIDPVRRFPINTLPFNFHFKKTNMALDENKIRFRIEDIDIIGGSIQLGIFMESNTFSDDYAYQMTASFANGLTYPTIRQPIPINRGVRYLSIFDLFTWTCLICTMAVIIAISITVHAIYERFMPSYWLAVNTNNIAGSMAFFLSVGFIHPMEYGWFKKSFSAGAIVLTTWAILALFIHFLYTNFMRSVLIGQEFETPIEAFQQENPLSLGIFLPQANSFRKAGLPLLSSWLLAVAFKQNITLTLQLNMHPIIGEDVDGYVEALIRKSPSHIWPLTKTQFHDLAIWFQKRGKDIYLRQSSIPMTTFHRGHDYVWFLPKYYPFTPMIEDALLKIYQMGVVGKFKIPLKKILI